MSTVVEDILDPQKIQPVCSSHQLLVSDYYFTIKHHNISPPVMEPMKRLWELCSL